MALLNCDNTRYRLTLFAHVVLIMILPYAVMTNRLWTSIISMHNNVIYHPYHGTIKSNGRFRGP